MNKIILTGNIVKDTIKGDKIARTSIAVRREYKNENNEYETDFFEIIAFGHQADFMTKYVAKGDKVELVGRMQVRQYQTQDGITRKTYEVVVESIGILKSNKEQSQVEEDFDTVDDDMDIPF